MSHPPSPTLSNPPSSLTPTHPKPHPTHTQGALKPATAKDHVKQLRRGLGFCVNILGVRDAAVQFFLSGVPAAAFIAHILARKQEGDKNYAYAVLVLDTMQRAAVWLASMEPHKEAGWTAAAAGFKRFQKQLRKASLAPRFSLERKLADGSVVPFEALAAKVEARAREVVAALEAEPFASEARKVELHYALRDVLLALLMTSLPPQRGATVVSFQIGVHTGDGAEDEPAVHNPAGNRIVFDAKGPQHLWRVTITDHKNAQRQGPIAYPIPPGTPLEPVLTKFVEEAQDGLLLAMACPTSRSTGAASSSPRGASR